MVSQQNYSHHLTLVTRFTMKGTTVALALAPLAAAKQLVWPSKYDWVEDLQNNLGGYNKVGFMDGKSSAVLSTAD